MLRSVLSTNRTVHKVYKPAFQSLHTCRTEGVWAQWRKGVPVDRNQNDWEWLALNKFMIKSYRTAKESKKAASAMKLLFNIKVKRIAENIPQEKYC